MTWAVLATGESLSQAVVDSLRGKVKVVAVNNSVALAPWADALAAADGAWWKHTGFNDRFTGLKYTAAPDWYALDGVSRLPNVISGINSGLLGIKVAEYLGAKKIILLGFDMKGGHFFGSHPAPLNNPDAKQFERFKQQFSEHKTKIDIVNCTPYSALDCFRRSTLDAEL